jgi:hypothetical protein
MAGSWQHMTTSKGRLLSNERFTGMIENLGEAYEAAEECFGMVWWLAEQAAARLHGTVQPTRAQVLDVVRQAQANYRDGLEIGGRSR